jgi:hypothetical protein
MPVTSTPAFAQAIAVGVAQILPADTTTLKTVLTAGANGALIDSILVSSSDTSSRDLQFWTTLGGVDYLLCTITIPGNSGFTNSAGIQSILDNARFGSTAAPLGLQILDPNGNKLLRLAAGEVLKAKCLTTVTAAKAIYIRASGADL